MKYAPSIDEMVFCFPENRQYLCQYVNTRPHTINNIVNTTDIDNTIDRVRSPIVPPRFPSLVAQSLKQTEIFSRVAPPRPLQVGGQLVNRRNLWGTFWKIK